MAVRWYCRYPLSYWDVHDILVERVVYVDASMTKRWVVKFCPESAKRSYQLRGRRGLFWYVYVTYIFVGEK